MNRHLKRGLCLVLTLVLLFQAAPVMQVGAQQLTLPEVELGAEILNSDVFYLASTAATLQEGANASYLLRVGRGGAAESESSVLIKISDMTAQYGTDYTVAALNGEAETELPEENCSLLDLFRGTEYEQSELKPEDEAEDLLNEDPEAMEEAQRNYAEAFNILADLAGVDADTETAELDEVSQARNLFTGVEGTNQHLTTTGDSMQQLQDVADLMTTLVPGAQIRLTFAAGEKEKFLLITPEDNDEGDGDRTFYLILSDPTGTTTNSAASSCACTIADDEVQTPSVVRFSQDTYTEIKDGMLRVTVEREGALNTNVSVTVRTTGGSAEAGRDYAEVDREMFFPFGISSQYVDIPVRTDYIESEADFGLTLIAGVDCTAEGDARAVLTAPATRAAAADDTATRGETGDEDGETGDEDGEGEGTANNLLMVRTLPAINIEEPYTMYNTYNSDFCGHNEYDASKGAWALQWDENAWFTDYTGKVWTSWKLSDDMFPVWIAGARVTLETTDNHGRDDHHATIGIYVSDYSGTDDEDCAYKAQRSFGKSTVDFYMTEAAANSVLDKDTNYLTVLNDAACEECNWLYIYSIEPILRPFQGRLIAAEPLLFLQADGTYRAIEKDPAVAASIKDSVKGKAVYFLDDAVTVVQPSGENVTRYSALTGLDYVPCGDTNRTSVRVATNADTSKSSIEVKVTKDLLSQAFFYCDGAFLRNDNLMNTYLADPNVKDFYKNNIGFSYPTYGDLALRPVFDYIDAKVTLQNPLDVPICYTISGTEYWLAAKDSYDIPGLHVGDAVAITDLRVGPGYEGTYNRVGVDLEFKADKADKKFTPGSLYFDNDAPIYVGGKRLSYQEVIINPVFTEKDNQIVVRVKTTDVSKFEKTGLFALTGTQNGIYTDYVVAAPEQTIPGRIYEILATPKSENQVCIWTVYSGYRYLGGSFLFEAAIAGRPEENVIQLTLAAAASEIKLTGTLTYMDYNLRAGESGGASARPAASAAVAAGTMYGITDEEGHLTTNTMKIPTNPTRYRVRCLISTNGSSVIKDITLTKKTEIDISQTFDSGLSPVAAPIYGTVRVTCAQADVDGLIPMKTTSNEKMTFKVCCKPVSYTSMITGADGKVTSATYFEKPLSVQLVTRDAAGIERRAWDVSTTPVLNTATGEYEFTCTLPYIIRVKDVADPSQPDYEEAKKDETVIFSVEPGDTYYLRLTTDLLSEVGDMEFPQELLDEYNRNYIEPVTATKIKEFSYSDVNTGLSIYPPPEYTVPIKQGLTDPIAFEFGHFSLLSSVGMNFQFPFVNIGYMQIDRGYRVYIGISVTQIVDTIYSKQMESPISKFNGDDGTYWGALFSMAHPIKSFVSALGETWDMAFNRIGDLAKNGAKNLANLGAAQWRFEFVIGVYFDFFYMKCTDSTGVAVDDFVFSGIGGYVSITVGFKKAWYTILPVVFIPAYFGIEITVTGMGFFGVQRDDTPPEIITYNDAKTKPQLKFEGQFDDEFNWCIMAYGCVQVSLGVGLCGTIGIRVAVEFNAIVNYEPSDVEGIRDWGVFLNLRGGLLIDLFLTTIPIWYDVVNQRLGKFADFENRSVSRDLSGIERTVGDFRLRSGSEETSEWVGASTEKRGAFTPKQTYTLVKNGYEHADPQLITLKDGTVVLAYLSNDPDKGAYQRTTLMITTYKDGVWKEPVAVSDDGTADFQPSIAETNDGRVLLAWVSTEADDVAEDTAVADYLRQMEVFAAFAEIGEDGTVTVGETQRITKDQRVVDGEATPRHYYDANPTVVCDTESGDAIIYYIKSGSATADGAELANPYVNDSVVCYLPFDSAKDKWMTDEFYEGEIGNPASEAYLIENFCGQRFLDAPTFVNSEGDREYYAIPDFTAIGYDGLAVYAYTVDRDSSNDTDTDKELLLQVYSFENHSTYHRIILTDDVTSDALPQFIRTDRGEEGAATKLFWYRGGNVCYIDVSNLLRNGINPDGTLIEMDDGSGATAATPTMVATAKATSEQSNQMANFRVAQDAQGRIYVLWTEAVREEADDIVGAQEVFAVGYNVVADTEHDTTTSWSKPYQLTKSGLQNDEVAITLVGDDLLLVHNQYDMEVTDDANEPLKIVDMTLAATTLEPCGSVVTDDVVLTFTERKTDENGTIMETPVTQPSAGDKLTAKLTIDNNGLTTADGYHVDVYAVKGESEEKIWSHDSETRLLPNEMEELTFDWTLPADFDGMFLRVDTKENNYSDIYSYETAAFEMSANYKFTEVRTYQADDGFHLVGTLTNIGNAATREDEELSVVLTGPYDLAEAFSAGERILYRQSAPTLQPGETCLLDLVIDIPAAMLERSGYIRAVADVSHEVPYDDPVICETIRKTLGGNAGVEFSLTRPLGFTLLDGEDLTLTVGEEKQLSAAMELPDYVGGSEVTYSVADPNVASVDGSKLTAVAAGETEVYATHTATGATVSVHLDVGSGTQPQENPFTDVKEEAFYYESVLWAYHHDPRITAGVTDTTFVPDGDATRAQVVTFLWRAAGNPEPKASENPFTDVPDGSYYAKAVQWASEEGITNGTSATSFSPDKTCTRGEFVTFLYRMAGSPAAAAGTENPFFDVKETAFYYHPVLWAVEQEVTKGTSATTFSPDKLCTRGEIVTFLYRWLAEE